MDEEEQDNKRAASPYHEKCFPPYCDSAGQIDKQLILKMSRSDLEDKYIIYADENLKLKRQLRDNERQVQRLQTAIARQDKLDKKTGVKMQYDNSRYESLEAQNKHLQAKIKVLKQQLLNHSYIHSKDSRIADEKNERRRKENTSPERSHASIVKTQSVREPKPRPGKDSSKEIAELKTALKKATDKAERLEQQLKKEREGKSKGKKLEDDDDEIEQFKKQLCHALMENERLKKQLDVRGESDKGKFPSPSSSKSKTRAASLDSSHDMLRKNEDLQRQIEQMVYQHKEEKNNLEGKLFSAIQEINDLRRQLESRDAASKVSFKKTVQESLECDSLKEQLCSALVENEILKNALEEMSSQISQEKQFKPKVQFSQEALGGSKTRLVERDNITLKSSSSRMDTDDEELKAQLRDALQENKSLRLALESARSGSQSSQTENIKRRLDDALMELQSLRRIAAEHGSCPKSRPHSPAPSPVASSHSRPYSTQEESDQKSVVIIVSKHEFDPGLLKSTGYKESDLVLPGDGKERVNCRLDICIYDLEMDNHMLDYLSGLESDPKIFVMWDYLGLQQRTASMPATQAHFHTSVTYFGPLSKKMVDHVKEYEVPVYLMLEGSDGSQQKVGEGCINLIPALKQPSRGFLRCICLSSGGGQATVYCSFKLHSCCSEEGPPAGETLEIGIGHLTLKSADILSNPLANHLYVEYTLLGRYGPELETDSQPKGDLVRFDYNKRLNVTDNNADSLQPMLQEDNPKSLKFILLSEPCSLTEGTEVQEIGFAEVNLFEEMVRKDQDVISAQLPVYGNDGDHLGSLSVTVVGVDTLQNHVNDK